jgi:hypothetical protein
MNACAIVGSVCPAFNVPGISRSGTIFLSRNTAVVVANDPIPSASRKLVTAPSAIWNKVGAPASVAGVAPAPRSRRAFRIAAPQPAI